MQTNSSVGQICNTCKWCHAAILFNAKQEDLLKFLVYWSGTLSGGLIPNPVSRLIELASEDLTADQRHSVPLPLLLFLDNHCLHASPMISALVHIEAENYLLQIPPVLFLPKEPVLGVQQPNAILLCCDLEMGKTEPNLLNSFKTSAVATSLAT